MRNFQALHRFPLKTLVAIGVLCLVLKEEFPFSHFPMYSSFSNYTYYVYVTDKNGEPIPLEAITSVRTSKLKKILQNGLDDVKDEVKEATGDWPGFAVLPTEAKRPAGEATLRWLRENCKESARAQLASHAPLTLHQVELFIDDEGRMVREDEPIASGDGV
ncbi:hypothetical protein BH23VER1_BH23VER1_27840 [soil metagenome]